MNKAPPVGSKLLSSLWMQWEQKIHRDRIRKAKPTVDISEPLKFRHIEKKKKKEQMLEGNSC